MQLKMEKLGAKRAIYRLCSYCVKQYYLPPPSSNAASVRCACLQMRFVELTEICDDSFILE